MTFTRWLWNLKRARKRGTASRGKKKAGRRPSSALRPRLEQLEGRDLPSANLVADIGVGPNGSVPESLVEMNGTLFFSDSDDVHGVELWKSDGTEAGTVLVKDIV